MLLRTRQDTFAYLNHLEYQKLVSSMYMFIHYELQISFKQNLLWHFQRDQHIENQSQNVHFWNNGCQNLKLGE